MPRSGWGRILIAIFIGGVLASAVTVLPAVGQDSPPHPVVDIGTGRLVAKGAAVNVPVTYTCGPATSSSGTSTWSCRSGPSKAAWPEATGTHLLRRRGLQERRGLGHGHPGRPTRELHHRGGVRAGGIRLRA